jgi:predicted GIY-YIG superfamily endonuclease
MQVTYYVYEIMNLMGTVEYVGMTSNYKLRKWRHFAKPTKHHGKFYGRIDCLIYVVAEFTNKEEALIQEKELHEYHRLVTQGQKISQYSKKYRPATKFYEKTIIKSSINPDVYYNSKKNWWTYKAKNKDGKRAHHQNYFPSELEAIKTLQAYQNSLKSTDKSN